MDHIISLSHKINHNSFSPVILFNITVPNFWPKLLTLNSQYHNSYDDPFCI